MTTENNDNLAKLTQLTDLTKSFKAAVENAGFFTTRKLKKAATSDEMMGLVGDAMGSMMSSFFGTPAPTEASLKKELTQAETFAGIAQRALSEKKLAKLVPAAQKTEQNAQDLKAAGFPKLAQLYTPKA